VNPRLLGPSTVLGGMLHSRVQGALHQVAQLVGLQCGDGPVVCTRVAVDGKRRQAVKHLVTSGLEQVGRRVLRGFVVLATQHSRCKFGQHNTARNQPALSEKDQCSDQPMV
jgi:hypothetical protein